METFDSWSPLFSSIVASSIWGLQPHIKVVWITMIALKDKNGFVAGSVPGLARLAAVSVEECREAIAIFEAPDEDSKCKKDEGRRIKSVEGGWMILGHQRFQKKMKEISTRVGNATRQARWRERKRPRLRASKNTGPLPGETGYVKAMNNGASQEELDRLAEGPM